MKKAHQFVGLSIELSANETAKSNKAEGFFGRCCLTVLTYICLLGFLWSGLELYEFSISLIIAIFFGAAASVVLSATTSRKWFINIVIVFVLAVLFLALREQMAHAINDTANHIFAVLERRIGRIFPHLDSSTPDYEDAILYMTVFFTITSVLVGLFADRLTNGHKIWRILGIPLVIAIVIVSYAFRLDTAPIWLILLTFVMLGILVRGILLGNSAVDKGRAVIPLLMSLAAVFVVVIFLGLFIFSSIVSADLGMRSFIRNTISSVRFERESPVLPEGDFRRLGNREYNKNPLLEVTMSRPQPMYLRGFVGEVYTGYGWQALTPETLGNYAGLFSWLRGEDFFGQSQFANLALTVDRMAYESRSQIKIRNVGASSRYVFTPYGLESLISIERDYNMIGDQNILSRNLAGLREYSFNTIFQTGHYERLRNLLAESLNQGDEYALAHLETETAFREFVYNNYLYLPEHIITAIDAISELPIPPQDGRASISDIRNVVSVWLLTGFSESNEIETISDDEDFFLHFAQVSRSGYSVHFATAATILFRYYGVPARYVEGFLITYNDVTGLPDYSTLVLNGSHAHAWAEIYIDGVGFVPFEPTPPHFDATYESAAEESGGGEETGSADDAGDPETQAERSFLRFVLLLLLILLAMVLLLFISVVIIRRRLAQIKRKKLFEDHSNANAVCSLLSYSVTLAKHMGIPHTNGSLLSCVSDLENTVSKKLADEYYDAVLIQREAMFSRNEISDERRSFVYGFMGEMLSTLKDKKTWIQRMKLCWLLRVY